MLASTSLLLNARLAVLYLKALDLLLTFVIFSNVVFYRYFNDLISVPLLFQARNLSDVQSSMLELLHWSDLLLVVDLALLPVINKVIVKKKDIATGFYRKMIQASVCFITGIAIVLFGFVQLLKSQPTILQNFYDRVYIAQNVGLLNYHAADVYTFVQQSAADDNVLDEQKQKEIMAFFRTYQHGDNGEKQLFGAGRGKNLIVIQAEALQQFVMRRTINGQEITPNLNKLAESGIYFDNYYFQTAGGGTSDAEFTSLVSMFPMKEGAVYIRKPGNTYFSLPRKLKENGYSTMAMHGYKPGFWNRSVVYKNLGIDEFYSMSNMDRTETLGMGISDKSFFRQAVDKLEEQKKPSFTFLITLSNHFPYDNDKSFYGNFDVGIYKDTLIGDYLESVHYADEALGEFIEALQSNGVLKDSVLVLYGDHHGIPKDNREELAQFLGKESLSTMEWLQLQKVPMIIKVPGVEPMEVHTVGGAVDLMPTLLNILGVDATERLGFGRDLINEKKGLAVLRNGSFISDELLYISSENNCYDSSTGALVPLERYQELKQQADRLLNYSDIILKYDFADEIKEYMENNDK